MSHDLAVYVGAQPTDAAEAMAAFDRLSGTTGQASPPSAPIRAFLDDLARVLPDDHEAWASPPPSGGADGDTLVLPLTYGDGTELGPWGAGAWLAQQTIGCGTAARRGRRRPRGPVAMPAGGRLLGRRAVARGAVGTACARGRRARSARNAPLDTVD